MHKLLELMAERISSGLKRKSLTSCSRWASAIRVMGRPFPGPWTFRYHPWLREMHDSEAEMNIGQKSAQMGYTETALNITLYNIDSKGVDCLYVLPAKTPDASDFSSARFDPALELSPHLGKLFSDVKNIGHKRAGTTNLYIRGSRSRSGLKSIPVGLIILDEVDEMDQDNIPLALERSAGQLERQIWAVSTPTIPRYGINKLFMDTTQEHFQFKCPACSVWTELTFPECVEITAEDVNDVTIVNSFLKCKECKGKLEHATKNEWLMDGRWLPSYSNRASRGFIVNQLYSSTVSPVDISKAYLRSMRDPTEEQEFFNSKLGLPHIVEGAGVTDSDLDACLGEYKSKDSWPPTLTTLGIDVGRWLHYEIDEWKLPKYGDSADLNVLAKCRVLKASKCQHFEELHDIVRQYNVLSIVIDANPERRKAYEFASRYGLGIHSRVKLCFYAQGIQGKQIHAAQTDEPTINVDRTSWLDLSLGRYKNRTIQLPIDISQEYRAHIKSLVRVYEKDRTGNPVGRYIKGSEDDHFAHARNYAELALPFAMGLANPQDIVDE